MNSLVRITDRIERPRLGKVLNEIGPLPREALFMGMASDGLPVMLNLHDPIPGPILIVSDEPTQFLAVLAAAAVRTHDPKELQFNVLSDSGFEIADTPHLVGNFAFNELGAVDVIGSLATWAHANKQSSQSVLLLVEGLPNIERLGPDAVQNFRWLLLRGPSRRVWPYVTLNAKEYTRSISWLGAFRTIVYGRIENRETASFFGVNPGAVSVLQDGQFMLKEGESWMKFVLPNI